VIVSSERVRKVSWDIYSTTMKSINMISSNELGSFLFMAGMIDALKWRGAFIWKCFSEWVSEPIRRLRFPWKNRYKCLLNEIWACIVDVLHQRGPRMTQTKLYLASILSAPVDTFERIPNLIRKRDILNVSIHETVDVLREFIYYMKLFIERFRGEMCYSVWGSEVNSISCMYPFANTRVEVEGIHWMSDWET
jgi:hypothetical protein